MTARRARALMIAAAAVAFVAATLLPGSLALADDDDVAAPGVTITIPGDGGGSGGSGSGGSGSGGSGSGGSGGGGAGSATPTPAPPGSICSISETGEPIPGDEPTETDVAALLDRPGYAAGDTVTVVAGGFAAGQNVQIVRYPDPTVVTTVAAGADGAVSATFAVPSDAKPGPQTLQLTGWNCGAVAHATLVVSAMGNASTAGPWWLLGVLAALLISIVTLLIGLRGGWFERIGLGAV